MRRIDSRDSSREKIRLSLAALIAFLVAPPLSRQEAAPSANASQVPDLVVKLDRAALQSVLSAGMRSIQIQGMVGGRLFIGERSVGVILPGNKK